MFFNTNRITFNDACHKYIDRIKPIPSEESRTCRDKKEKTCERIKFNKKPKEDKKTLSSFIKELIGINIDITV